MSAKRTIHFGVIGCGLMGREFASAAARWCHLLDLDFEPRIVAVCDPNPGAVEWFTSQAPTVKFACNDYHELIGRSDVEAVYCAVPHNLHDEIYAAVIETGKHLLGEKPFGIDRDANDRINRTIAANPSVLVRCSSEFPFFPGAFQIARWVREKRFGRIIEIEAGFWHSSDLDPNKPINWKRRVEINGEYGCMGDLGMHVLHLPLRFGWRPTNVRAMLSNVMPQRPDAQGRPAPCETWDNAILATTIDLDAEQAPMILSTKRIAPGHANTWFLRVIGTECSARFSTKQPKTLAYMPYSPGGDQEWRHVDTPHESAYPTITGRIFEFGFSDAILQMWAAFCDELVHGDAMAQPLKCVTPDEAAASHAIFTAALESHDSTQTASIAYPSHERAAATR